MDRNNVFGRSHGDVRYGWQRNERGLQTILKCGYQHGGQDLVFFFTFKTLDLEIVTMLQRVKFFAISNVVDLENVMHGWIVDVLMK